MSDNFDLKKYLIENKATTNSRMLSENEAGKFYAPTYLKQKYGEAAAKEIEAGIDEMDANAWDRFTAMESAEEVEDYIVDIKDMLGLAETKKKHSKMMKEAADFKVKLLVPTVYYDVTTGELADSPNKWYTEDELEDADVTSYTDGNELATVVFDSNMARAKQMEKQYPGLFKVMPIDGMAETKKKHFKMNESSEDFIKSIVDQFPKAVEEYGFENVESAFEQMYENAWENARAGFMYPGRADTEEATDYATKEVLKTVKFFKKTPGELESYIEEMIEMRG